MQHYQQELEKLEPTMASTNTRKDSDRRRMRDGGRGKMTVMQEAQQVGLRSLDAYFSILQCTVKLLM